MLQFCKVAMLQCCNVAMLQCYNVRTGGLLELLSQLKITMFAKKTKAQNIEFWPNGGYFHDDKKFNRSNRVN